MQNMLELGKSLIVKGNELNDPELVSMGMSMLEKYKDDVPTDEQEENVFDPLPIIPEKYVCTNCSYTFAVDKPGRKKCPECKKHTLQIISVATTELRISEPKRSGRATADDFLVQIRETKKSRIRYNEKGEEDGTYADTQQVEGISNVWKDDGEEGKDRANELLKEVMKISPRTRRPTKLMSVVCEECKKQSTVHPLHAGGRGRYLCDKCIKRRSKI